MVINTQGKPRLTKFYEHPDSHLVYKHFATLYFVFVSDSSENELPMLDLIQVFVETLDKCFKNVCKLDIVFNYDKMHTVIDVMIFGGQAMETNSAEIMRAVEEISSFHDVELKDCSLIWNSDLIETLELEKLLINACIAMHSAEARKERRGAHACEDFTKIDDENWMKHTLAYIYWVNEKVRLDYRRVHMNTLDNEVETFPPKTRVY